MGEQMGQHFTLGVVCLGLVLGGVACAPKWVGPTAGGGYTFAVEVSDSIVWLGPVDAAAAPRFPQTATVSVTVRDAEGRPADNVPVTFALEPDWTSLASLVPAETRTRGGRAQAVFSEPRTSGVVSILVRVDGTPAQVRLTVESWQYPSNNRSERTVPGINLAEVMQ